MQNKTLIIFIVIVAIIFLAFIIYFLITRIFKKKLDCKSKVLFIGDSITAFTSSYAEQLAQACPGLNYKKISQVGMKTDWMLQQLQNELNNYKYDAVFILGGTNDIFASANIAPALYNLQQMYSLARNSGAIVVAIAPPSINYYSLTNQTKSNEYAQLKQFIKSAKDVNYYFDFGTITNSSNMFGADELHPNTYAHSLLENQIYNQVFTA